MEEGATSDDAAGRGAGVTRPAASGPATGTCLRGGLEGDQPGDLEGDPAGHPGGAATRPLDGLTWPLDGPRPERDARRVVISVLSDLGIGAERRDDAELAIQELVANARLYAPGPYELRIRVDGTAVTLSVADGGGDHAEIGYLLADGPVVTVPAAAERGRGLRIVSALFPGACGAGPARGPVGGTAKQVWIIIALDDEPA